jgi:hypothetical protein
LPPPPPQQRGCHAQTMPTMMLSGEKSSAAETQLGLTDENIQKITFRQKFLAFGFSIMQS